jgi:hypothetical protein
MDLIKSFSADYANAVTAFCAVGSLILTLSTLLYIRREYRNKYRPYVFANVLTEPIHSGGFSIFVIPHNVGSHPCEVRIKDLRLHIGDEIHDTPSMNEWVLVAHQVLGIKFPGGHVNPSGIQSIREGRFRSNRIEVSFNISERSMDGDFLKTKSISYEINVQGETPSVVFRPEWHKVA